MDEWSFALLSCKVFIKCFLADQSIYQKGETSDYAYVVLGGSVKVSVILFGCNLNTMYVYTYIFSGVCLFGHKNITSIL